MSGDTVGTAMDALFLLGGGLGFARLGWIGVNPGRGAARAQAAPEPEQEASAGTATAATASSTAAPADRPSAAWQILSALTLLFGGAIALCGLLLGLSLLFPGSGQ